jgi:hypothetical protein
MLTSGDIQLAASYLGEEHSDAAELLSLLVDGLRSSASLGEIRAAGVCFDALTIPPGASEKSDAICMKLTHAALDPVDVFFPYEKGWLGRVSYAEGFAAEGSLASFRHDDPKEPENASASEGLYGGPSRGSSNCVSLARSNRSSRLSLTNIESRAA